MNDTINPSISGFIRGSVLPAYNDYCPLTYVDAFLQENGNYLVNGYDVEVGKSDIRSSAGFLVVQLGRIERDFTLEMAASAIYQSLHSLFAACNADVNLEIFRTTVEFSEFMKLYRCNYSHVILIGHGSSQGIEFLDKPKPVAGSELCG